MLVAPFFLLLTSLAAPDMYDSGFPDCPIVECGDVNISYPFWADPDPSPAPSAQYCGYRGLRITCVDDNTPVFHTLTDNYTVTSINTSSSTISLIDSDVVGEPCPRAKHNVSIENVPALAFTPELVTITFYFNCSPNTTNLNIPPDNVAKCLKDEAGLSYIFNSTNPPSPQVYAGLIRGCKGIPVESRVRRADLEKKLLGDAFGQAMRRGFDLTWNPYDDNLADCKTCEVAGGQCGYVNGARGNALHCFCPSVVGSSECQQWQPANKALGGLSVKAKIGIGFGGIGLGILLTGIGVCLWMRRKRKLEKRNSSVTASFFKSVTPSSSSYGFNGGDLESSVGEYYQTPTFTYQELEEATGGFAEELGDGGFGTVYKGKLKDGRIVAIKCLHENTNRRVVQFRNEIEILNRLRHQNLVTLYGCSTRDSPKLILVYEFIPNGTVADHLHGARSGERALTWPLRMSVAIESAAALAYLHAVKPQIIHRDVKTSNILLDSDFHVKVADFGLSRLFPNLLGITHVSTAPQGTPGYVDPEYHQCYQLTDKSDVYSFGVVLVELVTSMPAVDISRKRNEINLSNLAMAKIAAGAVGEMADGGLGYGSDAEVTRMMKAVCELAFRCLQQEREMRPTMLEVLEELKRIEAGESSCDDQAKKKKGSPDSRDDVYLLSVADSQQTGSTSSPPFSPNTVDGNSWPSRSTTPFASV